MSIFSEVKAAAALIAYDDLLGGTMPWQFMKFPTGTPFFRLPLPQPFSAMMVPRRRQWQVIVDAEGDNTPDTGHPVGALNAKPSLIIIGMIQVLGQTSVHQSLKNNETSSDAFASAVVLLSDASGNAYLGAAAAAMLGSSAMRRLDAETALPLLRKARAVFRAVGTPEEIEEIEAKTLFAEMVTGNAVADDAEVEIDSDDLNEMDGESLSQEEIVEEADEVGTSHMARMDGLRPPLENTMEQATVFLQGFGIETEFEWGMPDEKGNVMAYVSAKGPGIDHLILYVGENGHWSLLLRIPEEPGIKIISTPLSYDDGAEAVALIIAQQLFFNWMPPQNKEDVLRQARLNAADRFAGPSRRVLEALVDSESAAVATFALAFLSGDTTPEARDSPSVGTVGAGVDNDFADVEHVLSQVRATVEKLIPDSQTRTVSFDGEENGFSFQVTEGMRARQYWDSEDSSYTVSFVVEAENVDVYFEGYPRTPVRATAHLFASILETLLDALLGQHSYWVDTMTATAALYPSQSRGAAVTALEQDLDKAVRRLVALSIVAGSGTRPARSVLGPRERAQLRRYAAAVELGHGLEGLGGLLDTMDRED